MAKIHATAIVSVEAKLASDVEVGPFCIIGPNVQIDEGTRLLSHVVMEGWTTVGKHNTFFPFSVIGAVPQDLKYKGEKTEVIIGDHNTIRESVTINLGTVQGISKTTVGDHNLIMAYVHLGHDCVVKNNIIIANSVGLAGHVTIDDFANVGGMVGIIQHIHIGTHAFVGGSSTVDRDVPPFCVVVGERPCELKGANIIGLRRKGFKADVITAINESLKLWKRTDVLKDQSLLEIETQYGEFPEVKLMADFIRKSGNGCVK
ncbi:MAG: acyl-ACP--UDP-N-acetylglucosamine O-acyltransferase [Bdellovibrionales bacterium]|nr:acyl-ACP--UDP-N-acetylglucosamine O-acyltransferase [Oligoflexia bacterium]